MDSLCNFRTGCVLQVRKHSYRSPVFPRICVQFASQDLMQKTLCHWRRRRISINVKCIVAQTKKLQQAINEKRLRELKGVWAKLRDFNSQEFIHIALISQLEILRTCLHGCNKAVNRCLSRADDDAIINVGEQDHVVLEVQAWIDARRLEATVYQALLSFLKPIKTSLL